MGRVKFTGKDATAFLSRLLTCNIEKGVVGQSMYSLVCNASNRENPRPPCRSDNIHKNKISYQLKDIYTDDGLWSPYVEGQLALVKARNENLWKGKF